MTAHKWRVHKDREFGYWVAEHPVYGRHAVLPSWERAFARAFGAASFVGRKGGRHVG